MALLTFLGVLASWARSALTARRTRKWTIQDRARRETLAHITHTKIDENTTISENAFREANRVNLKLERLGLTIAGEKEAHQSLQRKRKQDGRMLVLVVEDSIIDRQLLRIALDRVQEASVDLVFCDTVEEAVNWLKDSEADLVLLDLKLAAGEDGIESIPQLCQLVPVIIYTALDSLATARVAVERGADSYILKSNDAANREIAKAMVYSMQAAISRSQREK